MAREPRGIRLDDALGSEEEKEEESEERQPSPEPTLIQHHVVVASTPIVNDDVPTQTFQQENVDLDASVFAQQQQPAKSSDDHHDFEKPNVASASSIIKEHPSSNSVYPPSGVQPPSYKDQVRSRTRATVSQRNRFSRNRKQQQPLDADETDFIEEDNPPIVDAFLPHAVVVSSNGYPCNNISMICLSIVIILVVSALAVGLSLGLLLPDESSGSASAEEEPPTISPTTRLDSTTPTTLTTTGSGLPMVLVDGGDTDNGTAEFFNANGMYNVVANPLPEDSINSSNRVIKYVRNGDRPYDLFRYAFSIQEPNDILNGIQGFVMDLHTTRSVVPGTSISIRLEDSTTRLPDNYPTGRHSACSTTVTKNSKLQWERIRLDNCSSIDKQVKTVDTLAVFLDEGNLSNGTYYFDNLLLVWNTT